MVAYVAVPGTCAQGAPTPLPRRAAEEPLSPPAIWWTAARPAPPLPLQQTRYRGRRGRAPTSAPLSPTLRPPTRSTPPLHARRVDGRQAGGPPAIPLRGRSGCWALRLLVAVR